MAKSRQMLLLEIQGPGRFPGEHLQWIEQLCQVGAQALTLPPKFPANNLSHLELLSLGMQ